MEGTKKDSLKPFEDGGKSRNALPNGFMKLDMWFKKHIVWVVCILLLSLTSVRISFYNSIIKSPLYSLYLFKESDNKFFDDWAKALNNDWLNEKPVHAYHWWHKSFADYYFKKHPEKLKEIIIENVNTKSFYDSKDSSFVNGVTLWNKWYHGNQYHQEPLYPYLLAIFYSLHIDEVNVMIVIQLILGIISGLLLFFISKKYFGETVAVLTGFFYFLCGILMYNEIILLRTSWIVFFTMLNVLVIDKILSNQNLKNFILGGICIGISFLMQSTFALFIIGLLGILFFNRKNLTQYFRNAAFLLIGFTSIYSIVIVRNLVVGAPPFSISSVGPVTFISSNVYGTNSISQWSPKAENEADIVGKSNQNIGIALLATLKTYPSIISYCYTEWEKLKAIWIGIEYPNNENYYFYKQYFPVLQYLGFNFFLIAPLGLSGLIFCIYRRKIYWALYLPMIVQIIVLLTFYVIARFRAPLVILLLPFAAYAILECIAIVIKNKTIISLETGILGILIILSFSSYSTSLEDRIITDGNYMLLYDVHFKYKLEEAAAKQNWNEWLIEQKQFIAMEPKYIQALSSRDTAINTNYLNTSIFFVDKHKELEKVYENLGENVDAHREVETINLLNSLIRNSLEQVIISDTLNDPAILYKLAELNIEFKKYPQAIDILKKMLKKNSNDENINTMIGEAFLHNSQFDSSEIYDRKVLRLNEKNKHALYLLANVYFSQKKYSDAIEILKQLNSIELYPNARVCADIGRCFFSLNNYDSAIYYTKKAISLSPKSNIFYIDMSEIYKSIGKPDSIEKYMTLAQEVSKSKKIQ